MSTQTAPPLSPPPLQPKAPASPRKRPRLTGPARIMVFIVLPVLVVVAIVGAVLVGTAFRGNTISQTQSVPGSSRVAVDTPNAELSLESSSDSEAHIFVSGRYLGPEPMVTIAQVDGVTRISGGCQSRILGFCDLNIRIAVPATVPVDATVRNGGIVATGLDGVTRLVSSNGAVHTRNVSGQLEVQATNGAIEVRDSTASTLSATTTNGAISLEFDTAPASVTATTTNGAVTISVPILRASYHLSTSTVNGRVDDSEVVSDPDSARTVTAATTNGSIRIAEHDDRR